MTESISGLSIKELREMTVPEKEQSAFLAALEADSRKGVRKLAVTLRNKAEKERLANEALNQKKAVEQSLREAGYSYICGIDEVGRGPLAGPVMAAAVVFPEQSSILGIDDSKKLSAVKREALAEAIKKEAVCYAYGAVSPAHIDEINILNAAKKAMLSAVARLDPQPDYLLLDALELHTKIPESGIVHGDAIIYCIGAASIIAKVKRDRYMKRLALTYPQYGFERNMGYGTAEHIAAIKKYGLTPEHRRSFCAHFMED